MAATCIAAAPGVAAARAAADAAAAAGVQQHEEVVVHRKPSDRGIGGAELCEWWVLFMCVLWAESSCPTESRREKNKEKQQLT